MERGEVGGEVALRFDAVSAAPPAAYLPVLEAVSFTLERGTTGMLLGANGSGKTTLLRTAAGLWGPRVGTVTLAGGRSPEPARVALLLEDPGAQFIAGSVAGEIAFGMENRGWDTARIQERLGEMLGAFDLEGDADRDPRRLAAGEQQRVLLATALAVRPELLLLDDPFLHLGPGEAPGLWARLRRMVGEGEVGALLMAGHDADLAVSADRIGLLSEGRLVAWGGPEVLTGALPPGIEPPLGVWLTRGLADLGWTLDPGPFDVEALGRRIARSLQS